MAQKRAAGKPKERRRGGARQNPKGQLKKRMETRNTPGPRAQWKPGNMIYPVPAVLVTVADSEGNSNIITIAWTGTICTNPPMAYISVRPERYSYHMLRESGEFVINLATESMAYATDYCGVRSGRDVDKWKETGLTPEEQKKDKSTMPGMSDNPFDKVYLVTPAGGDDAMTERLTEKAKFHFDAELCATLAEAVELAHANTRRGLLVCGSEAAALEAAALLENS